ncbi:MAG TPA: STAS domain-containing protein [Solirubrobacteraceae bacterium]|nr:STAS domain-containing protein [Solirubrobacteraceae bacterium]
MPLASLNVHRQGDIVYAEVHGDIDMSNAADLRQELSRMTPNDALGLVVDLRDVTYLDSAGIRLLYHLREDLRTGRQKLRLVIADGSAVTHTLVLAGLDWGAEIVNTVDAAREGMDR